MAQAEPAGQPASTFVRRKYPHLGAVGFGTEAAPYTHTDLTGGIQTAIDALAADRGGAVEIQGATSITTPILLTNLKGGITLRGNSAGFMQDKPAGNGADAEGLARGVKIKCASAVDGIRFGTTLANPRPSAILIESLYLDGYAPTTPTVYPETGTKGISGTKSDHTTIQNVNLRNFVFGIYLDTDVDAALIDKVQVVECCRPIVVNGAIYSHLTNSLFSHNDWGAFIQGTGFTISSCAFVGNCKLSPTGANPSGGTAGYGPTLYDLQFGGSGCAMLGCVVVSYGYYDNSKSYVQAVVQLAGGTSCVGNSLAGPPDKNLIVAFDDCHIAGNTKFGSYSEYNIYVPGNNCAVYQPGWTAYVAGNGCTVYADGVLRGDDNVGYGTFTDQGARNIINGMSKNAGDPNSTGNWNGHAKRDGLLIRDTSNNITYLYHSGISGGRQVVA
jgi:hypothetical protein